MHKKRAFYVATCILISSFFTTRKGKENFTHFRMSLLTKDVLLFRKNSMDDYHLLLFCSFFMCDTKLAKIFFLFFFARFTARNEIYNKKLFFGSCLNDKFSLISHHHSTNMEKGNPLLCMLVIPRI